MDIKELMLGDLVIFEGEPMRVVFLADIMEDTCRLMPLGEPCTIDLSADCMDAIQPLPITVAILSLNHFEKIVFEDLSFVMRDKDRIVKLYGDGEGFDMIIAFNNYHIEIDDIKNIHEMQHALRMAGLFELSEFNANKCALRNLVASL